VDNLPRLFLVVWPALLFILSGCAGLAGIMGTPTPIDRSFLTDEPCAAPCWYGLTPGKSKTADVQRVLAELPFVDQAAITQYGSGVTGGSIEISFQCRKDKERRDWIIIQGGIVQKIALSLQYSLTFGEVVEKLGPPDYVWVSNWGDTTGYIVDLYYVQQGIVVGRLKERADRYINWSDGSVVLAEEMEAASLIYSSPSPSLRDDLASQGIPSDEVEQLLKRIPPWPGWGKSVPMGP
jgi:hypothetical protein